MPGDLSDSRSAPAVGERPRYLPALDGLRAVSVAVVVAFHLGHLRGGFLGVDVFFVVSGYLITRLLLAEVARNGRVDLRAFWGRRFRRLLPALLLVLAATAVAGRAWLPAWRLGSLRADGLSALAYVANWRFAWSGQSYFADGIGPSPLRHLWSLAIEEQFYVVWPVVVVLLVRRLRRAGGGPVGGLDAGAVARRVGRIAAGATLVSGAWMAVAAAGAADLSRVYYGTDTRVFAICAGAWLATRAAAPVPAGPPTLAARAQSLLPVLGTLVLVVLVVTTEESSPSSYRGAFQLAALASVVTVAGLAAGTHPLGAVLGSAPFRWVGRRSYGIYLWSWPTQVFAQEYHGLEGAPLALTTVAVSVAAAAISFRFVEEPVRLGGARHRGRYARATPPGRRLVAGAASMGVVGVLLVGVAADAPAPPAFARTSDEEVVAAALAPPTSVPVPAATVAPPPATVDPGSTRAAEEAGAPAVASTTAPAPAPAPDTPLRVMVAGDSVAWSLGIDVPPEALAPGLVLDDRALVACGVFPPESRWIAGDRDPAPYAEYCDRAAEAEAQGLAGRPDVVLLWIGAWEVYDHEVDGERYRVGSPTLAALLEARLQARIDTYRAAGIPTVLARVGCFGEVASFLGDERHQARRLAWVNARQEAVAERNPGWVHVVDPTTVLCDDDGGPRDRIPSGSEVRPDGTHFDVPSATWLWQTWLGDAIRTAIATD